MPRDNGFKVKLRPILSASKIVVANRSGPSRGGSGVRSGGDQTRSLECNATTKIKFPNCTAFFLPFFIEYELRTSVSSANLCINVCVSTASLADLRLLRYVPYVEDIHPYHHHDVPSRSEHDRKQALCNTVVTEQ